MASEADPALGLAVVLHGFTNPGQTAAARAARIAEGIALLEDASPNEKLVGLTFQTWATPGGTPAASRMFEGAAQLMPGDPYIATYATQLAGARGDERDVVTRWQALIDEFPDVASPHNSLAYVLYRRGNEAGGMDEVRRYLELAPDHPNAHDSYAEFLQWSGRYPEALAEYRKTAELAPDFAQAYMGAAEVLVLVEAWEPAMGAIAQAIEHAPGPGAKVNMMRALASVQMLSGSRDGAMGQLEQAASAASGEDLSGARALVREQMAITDAMLGEGRFVGEYLAEAAAARGSENPLHLYLGGLAYAVSGDWAMARDASSKLKGAGAAGFVQNGASVLDAMVLLGEDEPQAAIDALADANPGDPIVQAVFARAYDRTNRPGAAAAMRQNVLGNRVINLTNPFLAIAIALARAD
jgi:tetratricopeptide (TPR) repeat protein